MIDGQVHKYHRRLRTKTKVAGVTTGLAILSLTFLAYSFYPLLQSDFSSISDSTTASESSLASAVSYPRLQPEKSLTAQLVFPYSVIPGGAATVASFWEAARREPVLAAHYAEFSLARARCDSLAARTDALRKPHLRCGQVADLTAGAG
jgi:hypothetical protein